MSTQPTSPGVYFATLFGERTIAHVFDCDGELMAQTTYRHEIVELGELSDWEGPIVDPWLPKPKRRGAIVDFSFEIVARCLNLPEGVEILDMQIDLFKRTLRCALSGPGLTKAHELDGFEGEQWKEAPVLSRTVDVDGRPVHLIERVGFGE